MPSLELGWDQHYMGGTRLLDLQTCRQTFQFTCWSMQKKESNKSDIYMATIFELNIRDPGAALHG